MIIRWLPLVGPPATVWNVSVRDLQRRREPYHVLRVGSAIMNPTRYYTSYCTVTSDWPPACCIKRCTADVDGRHSQKYFVQYSDNQLLARCTYLVYGTYGLFDLNRIAALHHDHYHHRRRRRRRESVLLAAVDQIPLFFCSALSTLMPSSDPLIAR